MYWYYWLEVSVQPIMKFQFICALWILLKISSATQIVAEFMNALNKPIKLNGCKFTSSLPLHLPKPYIEPNSIQELQFEFDQEIDFDCNYTIDSAVVVRMIYHNKWSEHRPEYYMALYGDELSAYSIATVPNCWKCVDEQMSHDIRFNVWISDQIDPNDDLLVGIYNNLRTNLKLVSYFIIDDSPNKNDPGSNKDWIIYKNTTIITALTLPINHMIYYNIPIFP